MQAAGTRRRCECQGRGVCLIPTAGLTRQGIPSLLDMVTGGKANVARMLLDRGADMNMIDRKKRTLLHHAISGRPNASAGCAAVVRLLLDRGAAIDCRDSDGYTPLHKALRKSAAESVVRLLLDRGASAMARALNGDTPLHIAAKSKKQGSAVANVAMLLDHHGMHARVASNG
eukprot:m.169729 g.169729  ORF g.169729 m.169729 type:complete len:173 (+) comp9925_c0_seq25:1344-1862(+)